MTGQAQGGYWFKRAIRDSDLSPMSRLVACILESVADTTSGVVRQDVSLTTLARWTGMSRRAVINHLQLLEAAGFLRRSRPEQWRAAKEHETTRYTVLVPAAYPVRRPSASGSPDLVHEATKPSEPLAPALVHDEAKPRARRAPSTTSTTTGGRHRPEPVKCTNGYPIAADDGSCTAGCHTASPAIAESA